MKKKIINKSSLILFTIMISFVFLVFVRADFNDAKFPVLIGFIFIGIHSIIEITIDNRFISMNKFYWHFQFIFFCVAPLCQHLNGYYPWGVYINIEDIMIAELMIIAWNLLYSLLYRIDFKKSKRALIQKKFVIEKEYTNLRMLIILMITVSIFIVLVKLIGFKNLFFRSENELDIDDSLTNFILKKILTSFPAISCVFFILNYRKTRSRFDAFCICVTFCFSLLSNFPTSTTRYWMGTIFASIFIVLFVKKKKSRLIDFAIIIGFSTLFPLFYSFKTLNIDDFFSGNIHFKGVFESFSTIDFDAFSLVARSVRFVRENGITYGNQLINVIFFFIPRSLWTTKPITTNVLIASSQNQVFTNLSCPLVAEGYVNFGVLGIVLYVVIYSRFNKFVDDIYWNNNTKNINIINIVYPFLCVITLYINRGPLQPSFIQTLMLLSPMIFINLIGKKRKELKNEKQCC